MKLTTTAFEHNEEIPSEYTCDYGNKAPVLEISGVSPRAKELVLIVDDPDSPGSTWVHWVLYNISPDTTEIDNKNLPEGVKVGVNGFRQYDWGGPCPTSGEKHRYLFKLYSLEEPLKLHDHATKEEIEEAMEGHIIDKAELIGRYKRLGR